MCSAHDRTQAEWVHRSNRWATGPGRAATATNPGSKGQCYTDKGKSNRGQERLAEVKIGQFFCNTVLKWLLQFENSIKDHALLYSCAMPDWNRAIINRIAVPTHRADAAIRLLSFPILNSRFPAAPDTAPPHRPPALSREWGWSPSRPRPRGAGPGGH